MSKLQSYADFATDAWGSATADNSSSGNLEREIASLFDNLTAMINMTKTEIMAQMDGNQHEMLRQLTLLATKNAELVDRLSYLISDDPSNQPTVRPYSQQILQPAAVHTQISDSHQEEMIRQLSEVKDQMTYLMTVIVRLIVTIVVVVVGAFISMYLSLRKA